MILCHKGFEFYSSKGGDLGIMFSVVCNMADLENIIPRIGTVIRLKLKIIVEHGQYGKHVI